MDNLNMVYVIVLVGPLYAACIYMFVMVIRAKNAATPDLKSCLLGVAIGSMAWITFDKLTSSSPSSLSSASPTFRRDDEHQQQQQQQRKSEAIYALLEQYLLAQQRSRFETG